MTITEQLDTPLDKADAVYKATDKTLGAKVTELESVLAAVIGAVKELDARLTAQGQPGGFGDTAASGSPRTP
ncbi:hypothetical protein [Pseudarthrobacter sp. N5]|uniref:hypothetical protein n=1 Tax=Pseudarthrobacter sp. N5 TaxID=3418416 RepID=UPI003CE977F9